MEIQLNSSQLDAFAVLEEDTNVFLSGGAGTGKSFLIRHFLKHTHADYAVLASTGAAAVLLGGRTFHSYFGLGIMEGGVSRTVMRALKNRRVLDRIEAEDGILIDEVSMITGEAMQAAEMIARKARDNDRPWGGLRVIAVGDFFQLPPITRAGMKRDWAFLDKVWGGSDFKSVLLDRNERSKDFSFSGVLNQIRKGNLDKDVRMFLDSRKSQVSVDFDGTRLFARRDPTEAFNLERLAKVKGKLHEFDTKYTGKAKNVETLKKNAPIPEQILLKEGALVMIRSNDPKGRWVNGSTGELMNIDPDMLTIRLKNGRVAELEVTSFDLHDADGEKIASAANFPISLAYAATIHKAQGMTLDQMAVDIRQLWEPGQAYVALSRVRAGEDLLLEGWDPRSVIVDPDVIQFYEQIRNP